MIEFLLPQTLGEWLAWLVALTTALVGLFLMIAPARFQAMLGLVQLDGRKEGLSEFRGPFGGVYVGLGLAVMVLHPQPLLYVALGAAFFVAVIGRLMSFVADRAFSPLIAIGTVSEIAGAFFPLAYAFGIIA